MSIGSHALTLDFIRGNASQLGSHDADCVLEHLAECENCAKSLSENQSRAELLLEAIHPKGQWTAAAEDAVAQAQNELLVFADAMLNRLASLRSDAKAALEAPLGAEARDQLWTLRASEPARVRVALACSEAVLALRSFLALGRRKAIGASLRRDRLLLNGQKNVPDQYFAIRIAEYTGLSAELALEIWHKFVDVLIEGKVGLSEIFITYSGYQEVSLSDSRPAALANRVRGGIAACLWKLRRMQRRRTAMELSTNPEIRADYCREIRDRGNRMGCALGTLRLACSYRIELRSVEPLWVRYDAHAHALSLVP